MTEILSFLALQVSFEHLQIICIFSLVLMQSFQASLKHLGKHSNQNVKCVGSKGFWISKLERGASTESA